MKVWRHLQKQLPGNRREEEANKQVGFLPSSSSPSRLQISHFVKQPTSASIFYDTDAPESAMSLSGTKLNGRSCTMDKNPNEGPDQTLMNNDSCQGSADAVKPAPLPKPKTIKKPHQQQQQTDDSEVNDSRKQTAGLIMCRHSTLFPPGTSRLTPKSAQERSSSATKPLPPVRWLIAVYHFCYVMFLLFIIFLILLTSIFLIVWSSLQSGFSCLQASWKTVVHALLHTVALLQGAA